MFSWDCPACGFSIRECRRCTEGNWMGEAVVLTPGGSRVIGEYDSYGGVGGLNLADQIDDFAMYHKACWELAGKPEFTVPSRHARDQGFCLACHDDPYYTVPRPTSPEWFTIAKQWHAIGGLFESISHYLYKVERAMHEKAYQALSEDDKLAFEHKVLGMRPDYKEGAATFDFGGETWSVCKAHLLVCCVKRDVRGEGWPESPQVVRTEYVGDGDLDQGCVVRLYSYPNGEYGFTVTVDVDMSTDVPFADRSGYADQGLALANAMGEATGWCDKNGVEIGETISQSWVVGT